jgi:hypothetical protein
LIATAGVAEVSCTMTDGATFKRLPNGHQPGADGREPSPRLQRAEPAEPCVYWIQAGVSRRPKTCSRVTASMRGCIPPR